jgi:Fur family peroxide stress response transcriptional regulator
MRLTPRRQAVLDVLQSATDHPTGADVYDRVRTQLPGVGPATIYRALGCLVSEGHAHELDLGSTSARYESNLRRHDHVVCRPLLPRHLPRLCGRGRGR